MALISINELKEHQTVVVLRNGEKFIVRKKTSMDEYGYDRYNLLLSRWENPEDNIIVNWLFPIDTKSPYAINNGLFVKEIKNINDFTITAEKETRRVVDNGKNFNKRLHMIEVRDIIQKQLKTTIKYFDLTEKYITVKYDKGVIDKDFSYTRGFLWCVYKLGNSHLSSNELQTKINLVMGDLTNKQQETYLKAYFLESGLYAPKKALKVLEELAKKDKELKKMFKMKENIREKR